MDVSSLTQPGDALMEVGVGTFHEARDRGPDLGAHRGVHERRGGGGVEDAP